MNKSEYYGWVIALAACFGLVACSGSDEAENVAVEISAVGLGVSADEADNTSDTTSGGASTTAAETDGAEDAGQTDAGSAESSDDSENAAGTGDPDDSASGSPSTTSTTAVAAETTAQPAQTTAPTTTPTTPTTAAQPVPPTGPLMATPPAAALSPDRNSHRVVRAGDGPPIKEGDTVRIDYLMVSWNTGEVVFSSNEEYGGPQSVVLGELEIPRYLESSIFNELVGSRLQVIYAPDLEDLPDGLDPSDAYLLAVDIVGLG